LYASFDLALTGPTPEPAMTVWERMEAASLLGHVPGTAFPGTFGHIVGGYAAGYYGYMWAEVLALDMLSAFGDDVMNGEVGRRFRREVLNRGGEVPAAEIVRRFLGRAVNADAFFKEIVGERV
jgi:thimet oligopeptidase